MKGFKKFISKVEMTHSIGGASTNLWQLKVFNDLKALLETLASSAEEVQVQRAYLYHHMLKVSSMSSGFTGSFTSRLIGYCADTAFTDPSAGTGKVLDDILDGSNAGDVEFTLLAEVPSVARNGWDADGVQILHVVEKTVDITDFTRKVARQMARSALFSTDPLAGIASIYFSNDDGVSCEMSSWIQLDYRLGPRQLRMLGAEH